MAVLNSFLSKVVAEIINPIILLLGALAFIVFLWGIIGLVIIFGAYGIINLALGTFGIPTISKTL